MYYKDLDVDGLVNALQDMSSPTVAGDADDGDVSAAISEGCCVIMDTATRFTRGRHIVGHMERGKSTLETTFEHQ